MKGTRARVVELLRQHGDMTVAALCDELSIAAPALRRHLDILAGEGMVDYRSVKQPAGRPYFVYRLTSRAREDVAGYARLLERLLEGAALLPAGDGTGRAVLDALLERLSGRLTEDYRARIKGDTLEERVQSLTQALRDEGILEQWQAREDGIHLYNGACPHSRAAMAAHELCSSERRAIALLLGEEVEQVSRMVEGAPCCEYVVRPHAAPQPLPVVS